MKLVKLVLINSQWEGISAVCICCTVCVYVVHAAHGMNRELSYVNAHWVCVYLSAVACISHRYLDSAW